MSSICSTQHRVDPDVPIEDVAGAVKALIQEGKSDISAFPRPEYRRFVAHMRPARVGTSERILALVETT